MLRYLFIFILLAASLLLTASAKGAIIHMIYNVAECHDPKTQTHGNKTNVLSLTSHLSLKRMTLYIFTQISCKTT